MLIPSCKLQMTARTGNLSVLPSMVSLHPKYGGFSFSREGGMNKSWMDEKCTDCKFYGDRQYGYMPSCEENGVTEVCVCWTKNDTEN